jgi:hypothetical protein
MAIAELIEGEDYCPSCMTPNVYGDFCGQECEVRFRRVVSWESRGPELVEHIFNQKWSLAAAVDCPIAVVETEIADASLLLLRELNRVLAAAS